MPANKPRPARRANSHKRKLETGPLPLCENHLKFCKAYLVHNNAKQAVIEAGYQCKDPGAHGYQLLKRANIIEFLKEARKTAMEEVKYGLKEAMNEAKFAQEFSIKHKNANALVKATEHRAKLNGLIDKNIQVQVVPFSVNIQGLPAPPPPVDVTPIVIAAAKRAAEEEEDD